MNRQLKPCPLCGSTIGVGIMTANNCYGKVYRSICWGNSCKHKLPSEWYEKRKEAVEAWNNFKLTAFASDNCGTGKKKMTW